MKSTAAKRYRALLLHNDPHCWFCGDDLDETTATLDHFRPQSKGGRNRLRNIVLACWECNQIKAATPVERIVCSLPRGSGIYVLVSFEGRFIMERRIGFNYGALGENASNARKEAKAIHTLLETTAANVVEIGKRLIQARELIGRKYFQQWLKVEFRWTQSVASNYMTVAERFGTLKCLNQFQPSALYLLARRKVEPETVAAAVKRAHNGETITLTVAKEIFAEHQPAEAKKAKPDEPRRLREVVNRWAGRMGREELLNELLDIINELRRADAPSRKPRRALERRELASVA